MPNTDKIREFYAGRLSVNRSGIARGLSFNQINNLEDDDIRENLADILSRRGTNRETSLRTMGNIVQENKDRFKHQGDKRGENQMEDFANRLGLMSEVAGEIHTSLGQLSYSSEKVNRVFESLAGMGQQDLNKFRDSIIGVTKDITSKSLDPDRGVERIQQIADLTHAQNALKRKDFQEFDKYYRENKDFFDSEGEFAGSDAQKSYLEWRNRQQSERYNQIKAGVSPLAGSLTDSAKTFAAAGGFPMTQIAMNAVEKGLSVGLQTYTALTAGHGGGLTNLLPDLIPPAGVPRGSRPPASGRTNTSRTTRTGRPASAGGAAGTIGGVLALEFLPSLVEGYLEDRKSEEGPSIQGILSNAWQSYSSKMPSEEQLQAGADVRGQVSGTLSASEQFRLLSLQNDLTGAGDRDAYPGFFGLNAKQMNEQRQRDEEEYINLVIQGGGDLATAYEALGYTAEASEERAAAAALGDFSESLETATEDASAIGKEFGILGPLLGATTLALGAATIGGSKLAAAGVAATAGITAAGADFLVNSVSKGVEISDAYFSSSTALSSNVYRGLASDGEGGANLGAFSESLANAGGGRMREMGFSSLETAQALTASGRSSFRGTAQGYMDNVVGAAGVARETGMMIEEVINSTSATARSGGAGTSSEYMGFMRGVGASSSGEINQFSAILTDSYVEAARQLGMTSTTGSLGDIMGMYAMTRGVLANSGNPFLESLAQNNPELITGSVAGLDSFIRGGASGSDPFATGLGLRAGMSFFDMSQGLKNGSTLARIIGQFATESNMGQYLEGGELGAAGMDMVGMLSQRMGLDSGVMKALIEAHYAGNLTTDLAEAALADGSTTPGGSERDVEFQNMLSVRIEQEARLVKAINNTIKSVTNLNERLGDLSLDVLEGITDDKVMEVVNLITGALNPPDAVNGADEDENRSQSGSRGAAGSGSGGGRSGEARLQLEPTSLPQEGDLVVVINSNARSYVVSRDTGTAIPFNVES